MAIDEGCMTSVDRTAALGMVVLGWQQKKGQKNKETTKKPMITMSHGMEEQGFALGFTLLLSRK